VVEPSGRVLVAEYGRGRLLRIDAVGGIAVLAHGLHTPYALARTRNGTVYVTEAGAVSRATGTIRRVLPDGRTSLLRLKAPS
jgi:hypothetical protein